MPITQREAAALILNLFAWHVGTIDIHDVDRIWIYPYPDIPELIKPWQSFLRANTRLYKAAMTVLGKPAHVYMEEVLARNNRQEMMDLSDMLPMGYWKFRLQDRLDDLGKKKDVT